MAVSVRKGRALKRRFDAVVRTFAWYTGWAGALGFALCGLLWLAPETSWDGMLGLQAGQWAVYAMVTLVAASLLGWSFVNIGQDRVEKRIGRVLSALCFVVLPVFCLANTLWPRAMTDAIGSDHRHHPMWLFIRWYPPLVTVLCALVFLTWKSKPRKRVYFDRALGYGLLLAPYAILFAVMELGVHLDWLDESRRRTLDALGSAAIVLQIVVAFFISATD